MSVDSRELGELEHRIAAWKQSHPDEKRLAMVGDLAHALEMFVEAYPAGIKYERKFLDSVKALADKTRFSGREAGQALYVMHMAFFAGSVASDAKKKKGLEDSYCPVTQVFDIVAFLPRKLSAATGTDRERLLQSLMEACTFCPTTRQPGLANPMAYLSRLHSMTRPEEGRQDRPPWGYSTHWRNH